MKHYKFEQLSIPLYEYCIENKELNRTLAQIEAILKMEYDNNYLMLFENIEKYSDKKVQKIEEKLKANKNVPYIQVAEKDGVIYIVKGLNTYLASVRTGINVTKIFVETKDFEVMDQKQWLEILEEYKNK